MSKIQDDAKKMQIKDNKQHTSLATYIIRNVKRDNQILKVLLLASTIVNIGVFISKIKYNNQNI